MTDSDRSGAQGAPGVLIRNTLPAAPVFSDSTGNVMSHSNLNRPLPPDAVQVDEAAKARLFAEPAPARTPEEDVEGAPAVAGQFSPGVRAAELAADQQVPHILHAAAETPPVAAPDAVTPPTGAPLERFVFADRGDLPEAVIVDRPHIDANDPPSRVLVPAPVAADANVLVVPPPAFEANVQLAPAAHDKADSRALAPAEAVIGENRIFVPGIDAREVVATIPQDPAASRAAAAGQASVLPPATAPHPAAPAAPRPAAPADPEMARPVDLPAVSGTVLKIGLAAMRRIEDEREKAMQITSRLDALEKRLARRVP